MFDRFGNYDSAIWKKVDEATLPGGMGVVKRDEFLQDFADAPDNVIDALNESNGDLIEYWRQVDTLKGERVKIEYLRNLKQILIHPRLTIHIHVGHSGVNPSGGAWVTGGHNQKLFKPDQNGVIRWRWVDGQVIITNNKGYKYGFVERNMSDKNWSGGNPPTSWKKKTDETGFWPEEFDDKRINEEMAFASLNKKYERFESKRTGDINVYIGRAKDGQEIQINIDAYDPSNIISIYPINIK